MSTRRNDPGRDGGECTDDRRDPEARSGPADGVARLESEIDELESRVAELEAATEALRGYAGSVRSVNRAVERRADRALATAERLEGIVSGASNGNGAGTPGGRIGEFSEAVTDRDSEDG
ncbi:MAG: hypothetical protein V5A46_01425 [Haloferacaceae archaeon]